MFNNKINVAINGFGRIGRASFKIILDSHPKINVVAINDLTDTATLAHLMQYDSCYGKYPRKVTHTKDAIVVGGKKISSFCSKRSITFALEKIKC